MPKTEIFSNPSAKSWSYAQETDLAIVQSFHERLPGYQPTPLVSLPDVAKELGVKAVMVKDESNRLSLPAFKILGASWGIFRAITAKTGLDAKADLEAVGLAARKAGVMVFAATEGNHGRAVARMGNILNVPVHIYMSRYADNETVAKIESEGARVTVLPGTYDEAVASAFEASQSQPNGLLIQDNAFQGYEEIPTLIVQGYSTLLVETECQLATQGLKATAIVTPIGVGSLGHAVVAFAKSDNRNISVLTVEPESAACLYHNLKAGKWESIDTSATIMNGMNCGTVSPISWPTFTKGVDASTTIKDIDCHHAIEYLHSHGINAGPCGAAALVALRKVARQHPSSIHLDKKSVVVLLSTEGSRGYKAPEAH
ncbi:hypothetical protein PV10_00411 [Exophiala mesophila]|uniref:Tryptophan synthase beta chain-like PALP domain-containing protein n=1 Tax=Exophiala mesophila TaxID=212818 RepID=A0A0D1ZPQ0_EXOME|nr:uncharacterized protein PV10_00411 [Exophiala mesophila]KIV96562.1 hypothetical protein PV10_00411 [Exophiala mesophila]